jgi:hypothetical protein
MLLDMAGHDPLLPGGKSAADGGLAAIRAAIEAEILIDEHRAERSEIAPVTCGRLSASRFSFNAESQIVLSSKSNLGSSAISASRSR